MIWDLIVLVPDKHIEQTILGLLARHRSLGIRAPKIAQVLVHPNRDPGVYESSHELLQPFVGAARYALVILDRAWQGAPSNDPDVLNAHIEGKCNLNWGSDVRCVCIDPEIENWIWSDSPHVASELGWNSLDELRAWLNAQNLWPEGHVKPPDPKLAFEAATRAKRRVPSSAIFRSLAGKVGLSRCGDPAFQRLRTILKEWFAEGSSEDPVLE